MYSTNNNGPITLPYTTPLEKLVDKEFLTFVCCDLLVTKFLIQQTVQPGKTPRNRTI